LLAISEPGRRAELLRWNPPGKGVIEQLKVAIEKVGTSDRDNLTVAAMDRFSRLPVDAAGRPILPAPLASHLDTETEQFVRVVVK